MVVEKPVKVFVELIAETVEENSRGHCSGE
jgi:hypothetical protein